MSPARSSLMSPARFSGDVSGEIDFATIAHFCCCEISGKVSGSEVSLFFFYFVDEPFFCYLEQKRVIICYMEQKRDLDRKKETRVSTGTKRMGTSDSPGDAQHCPTSKSSKSYTRE